MHYEDLATRTERFAASIRTFLYQSPKHTECMEDKKQLMRASGSIAANFIEANEAHTERERAYRFALCRKESKESLLWLRLLRCSTTMDQKVLSVLIDECSQLLKIFAAISAKYAKKDAR